MYFGSFFCLKKAVFLEFLQSRSFVIHEVPSDRPTTIDIICLILACFSRLAGDDGDVLGHALLHEDHATLPSFCFGIFRSGPPSGGRALTCPSVRLSVCLSAENLLRLGSLNVSVSSQGKMVYIGVCWEAYIRVLT